MPRKILLLLALLVALPAFALPAAGAPPAAPRIGHVFVIVLENEGYDNSFGASPGSPYLAHTLPSMGRLLTQYYGTGHASLDNYVSMVSGQAPNPQTQGDCPVYGEFVGVASPLAAGPTDGQAIGQGCVYPAGVKTIGDQMQAAGLPWRAYAESMAASPGSAPTSCRHQPLGSQDTWQGESASDQYATRHEPFVYFHSVIDDEASCSQHVVDLGLLATDLQSVATTPSLAFITPDVCSDGHDAVCANASRPGGYAGIEAFLREWVPRIVASPAYQQDGLLVINFDEAGVSDATACCNEPAGFNTPAPGLAGPGGGRVGAVLLAPCLAPGVDDTPHNHYSLLRTLEDLHGLAHLGYAGQAGLEPIALPGCG